MTIILIVLLSGCGGITPEIKQLGVTETDYDKWRKYLDIDNTDKANAYITKWNKIGITKYDDFIAWNELFGYKNRNYLKDIGFNRLPSRITSMTSKGISLPEATRWKKLVNWKDWYKITKDVNFAEELKGNRIFVSKVKNCIDSYGIKLENILKWKSYKKNCNEAKWIKNKGLTLKDFEDEPALSELKDTEQSYYAKLKAKNIKGLTSLDTIKYLKLLKRRANNSKYIDSLQSIYENIQPMSYDIFIKYYDFYNKDIKNRTMGKRSSFYITLRHYFKINNKVNIGKAIQDLKYTSYNSSLYKQRNSYAFTNATDSINAGLKLEELNIWKTIGVTKSKGIKKIKSMTKSKDYILTASDIRKYDVLFKDYLDEWKDINSRIQPYKWIEKGFTVKTAGEYYKFGFKKAYKAKPWKDAGFKDISEMKTWYNLKGIEGYGKETNIEVFKLFANIPANKRISSAEGWIKLGFTSVSSLKKALKLNIPIEDYKVWKEVDNTLYLSQISELIKLGYNPTTFGKVLNECISYVTFEQLHNPDELIKGSCLKRTVGVIKREDLTDLVLLISANINILIRVDVKGNNYTNEYTRIGQQPYMILKITDTNDIAMKNLKNKAKYGDDAIRYIEVDSLLKNLKE